MDEVEAARLVQERLTGPVSLPLRIRGRIMPAASDVDELFTAVRVLIEAYRGSTMVPKQVALAFLDIAANFDNRYFSAEEQERLEDIGQELHRLGEMLLSDE